MGTRPRIFVEVSINYLGLLNYKLLGVGLVQGGAIENSTGCGPNEINPKVICIEEVHRGIAEIINICKSIKRYVRPDSAQTLDIPSATSDNIPSQN